MPCPNKTENNKSKSPTQLTPFPPTHETTCSNQCKIEQTSHKYELWVWKSPTTHSLPWNINETIEETNSHNIQISLFTLNNSKSDWLPLTTPKLYVNFYYLHTSLSFKVSFERNTKLIYLNLFGRNIIIFEITLKEIA